MKTDNEEIYTLIFKYLSGDITEDELSALDKWKSENDQNQAEFDDSVEVWRRTGDFQFPVKIDTRQALAEVHVRSGMQRQNVYRFTIIQQIAAVLVLSVLFSALYIYITGHKIADPAYYQEVYAAYGTRTNIRLPDGSFVFLNSGSSLSFPNQLGKTGERRVKLKGEGYFKVAKDSERPFFVETEKLSVKALGTEFNVNAYSPGAQIDVALIEGKVAIRRDGMKNGDADLILEPYELAHLDAASDKLTKELIRDPVKYTGWTEGKMVFKDDPIQDVVRRMENWYHVEIRIHDQQLLNYRFTGTFVDETLEEILNTFSLTSPLHYEIKPGVKNEQGEYSKRIIILKSKQMES